jgi:hypothetical protein
MGMETMHLIQTQPTTDLMSLSDSDLEAFFASAGLAVVVVAHCDTVGCAVCPTEAAAQAA